MTTATIREQAVRPAARQLRRYRALAVIGAGLAAVAVWTVAVLVLGVELHVSTGRGESGVWTIGPASVTAVSLLVSLLGWGLLALLERRTARARRIWTIIAFGVLLLSFGGPLSSHATAPVKVSLALMHVAVAAVLIPGLRHRSPGRSHAGGESSSR